MGTPDESVDEEKAFLANDQLHTTTKTNNGLSPRFWICAGLNTISTAAIVFVNKRIFTDERLKHTQVTFAAFHFTVTALLLFAVSRPADQGWINFRVFQPKPLAVKQVLPLAVAMIFNVVLPNASLAYSSIQFYQVARVLLTPCVVLLNYFIARATIPRQAAAMLVPVCVGVGIVSFFDTMPATSNGDGGDTELTAHQRTSLLGVLFAFSGVVASSLYTVWIARYHKLLECSSLQLLFNQAPVSVLLMLYIIPFSDDVTVWKSTPSTQWGLIFLSGILACLINLSQFLIINEAGPVSSTVVGHFKTCIIIAMGWIHSGKALGDGSLIGILMAIGGIVAYSYVTHKQGK